MESDVNELLAKATRSQRRWIVERLNSRSDAEAAKKIGVTPATICRWKKSIDLDGIIDALTYDPILEAIEILRTAAPEAARAKLEGLIVRNDDGTKGWNQSVASEVLNRVLGSPTSRHELTGKGGKPIEHEVTMTDAERIEQLFAILERARGRQATGTGDS